MSVRQSRIALVLATAALVAGLIAPPAAIAAGAGSFGPTGSMGVREGPAAAPLPDGRVLVAGGFAILFGNQVYRATAEVFNPATNSFSSVGSMATPRDGAAAAPLPDGRVLVVGGFDGSNFLNTAEIFNPATNSFGPVAGTMSGHRLHPVAATLPDGRVLVAGGRDGPTYLKSAEVFDPKLEVFDPALPMSISRAAAVAAPLPDGRVLVAGGSTGSPQSSAEVFSQATNSFSSAGIGSMGTKRDGGVAAPLPDGRVLVAGGYGGSSGNGFQASAEVFDPVTGSFSSAGIGPMGIAREFAAAAPLSDGRVLVAGGTDGSIRLASAEIYAATNSFSVSLKGRMLTINAQASGRVEVSDAASAGASAARKGRKRKRPLLKPASAAGDPPAFVVQLRLSKLAKQKLRRKGKVRVNARITFTPAGGLANTQTETLKIKKGKRKAKR